MGREGRAYVTELDEAELAQSVDNLAADLIGNI